MKSWDRERKSITPAKPVISLSESCIKENARCKSPNLNTEQTHQRGNAIITWHSPADKRRF